MSSTSLTLVAADDPALVNKELLRGITYDAASNTWRGEVFALKRGEFVPMTIRTTAGGLEMVAGAGLMSKTIEWVRVQEPPCGGAAKPRTFATPSSRSSRKRADLVACLGGAQPNWNRVRIEWGFRER